MEPSDQRSFQEPIKGSSQILSDYNQPINALSQILSRCGYILSFELPQNQAIKSLGTERSSDQGRFSPIKILGHGRKQASIGDVYVTTPCGKLGFMMLLPAMSFGDRFCMSRKWNRGRCLVYLKGATAWTYLGLVLEKLWLALGQSSMYDWAWETDLSLCRA